MAPQITLISGCSSGIGLSLAVSLAKDPSKGYIVYATMRNLAKKDKLVKAAGGALNKTLFITQLDVTKRDSITSAVKTIMDKHGRIDILVNNAGHGGGGFIEIVTDDQMRSMFDTNFFGVVHLTQEVIPHMKKQRSGRIISTSSVGGIAAWPFCEMYTATKFALEGFTESLAMSLRPFNIWVSSVQPGPVRTDFVANIGSPANNQPDLAKIPEMNVDADTKRVFAKFSAKFITGEETESAYQSPEEVAAVIRGVIEADEPHLRNPTSEFRLEFAKKWFVDPYGDALINTIVPHMKLGDDAKK